MIWNFYIEIIMNIIPVMLGVIIAFFITFFQNYFKEKQELKLWKIITHQELKRQRNIIPVLKNSIKKRKYKFFYIKLGSNNRIYDYDFAFKVLGKDFDIFLRYTSTIKLFDLYMEILLPVRLNDIEIEYKNAVTALEVIVEEINFKELDLIIDKIGKDLKNEAKLELEKKMQDNGQKAQE